MRSKNPELMKKILKYAEQYYLDYGNSPTTFNIAKALDIAEYFAS
ncbi:hypothetical protein [Aminicella lysinilytica]|uniref:Uncharacterized protein n=1 Tax=Aminicella lysinilytica TaxID=433323 RepID=A0A4R6Q422_9FIRM|nr:hypothetical protein [Aminicella lysinilytica]TDP56426.1 hypothetical protein EV211_11548 [Aminicella lysinilytica]